MHIRDIRSSLSRKNEDDDTKVFFGWDLQTWKYRARFHTWQRSLNFQFDSNQSFSIITHPHSTRKRYNHLKASRISIVIVASGSEKSLNNVGFSSSAYFLSLSTLSLFFLLNKWKNLPPLLKGQKFMRWLFYFVKISSEKSHKKNKFQKKIKNF